MCHQVGLLVYLLGTCVSVSLGLNVNFDRTPDSRLCAQLQCDEDVGQSDVHIAYLIGLSIYNITLYDTKVRLASLSIFDPTLYIDPSKVEVVNGTGSLTRSQGRLTLSFQDASDCLHGTFLCELDFVNVSGQPDSVSESTSTGNNDYCGLVEVQLKVLAVRVDNLTSDTQTLKHENLDLQSALENVTQRLAKLEAQVNSPISKPQVPEITCSKGMLSKTSRQEFLLWGRIPALCDTETDGGGWVVIQRRTKGDVDFSRNWTDYKNGFGTPDTDFWIGLDVIHNLTSQDYSELRMEYIVEGTRYYAEYSNLSVANESMKYQISGSGFKGTALDCLTSGIVGFAHNNMYFSTVDGDNDNAKNSCAEYYRGGWWYNACYSCNFNGQWGQLDNYGMALYNGTFTFLSFSEMKLRHD